MSTDFSFPLSRDDTLLGVCQALGEDFGFNPFWLRLALGVSLIVAPVAVIGAYFAAAVVVAMTRWALPDPRRAPEPVGSASEATEETPAELPLAA